MGAEPVRSRKEYPYPPRMMTRARAAHYCDLSEAEFTREVEAGRLPASIMLGSKPHWSRRELDDKLDAMLNGEVEDWRAGANFYRKRNAA